MSDWENLPVPSKRPWNLTRWKSAEKFIQVSDYNLQNIVSSVEIGHSEAH